MEPAVRRSVATVAVVITAPPIRIGAMHPESIAAHAVAEARRENFLMVLCCMDLNPAVFE